MRFLNEQQPKIGNTEIVIDLANLVGHDLQKKEYITIVLNTIKMYSECYIIYFDSFYLRMKIPQKKNILW